MCAGIGGLDIGLKLALGDAARTVCYIEREAYCARVLQARCEDGHLDDAPIWSDVHTFDSAPWRGSVDLITAGYPCQPFSLSGRRQGEQDERHLWPQILRHIQAIEPAFVFCENVPGHLTLGFEQVCQDLSSLGYRIEAGIFSAAEIGAPHIRQRLYFLAHAAGSRWQTRSGHRLGAGPPPEQGPVACESGQTSNVAHASGARCPEGQSCQSGPIRDQARRAQSKRRGGDVAHAPCDRGRKQLWAQCGQWHDPEWAAQSDVGRVISNGLPHRVDRLRALGNAVVPQVAAHAFSTLLAQLELQSVEPDSDVA